MIHVFRISTSEFIKDLSGKGAELYGGRWNRKGTAVLYTSANKSLAASEYFVNLDDEIKLSDNNYSFIKVEIPDAPILEIERVTLPDTWTKNKNKLLYDITEDWISKGTHFCMRVPSAVMEGEYNYLINPNHPVSKTFVRIVESGTHQFDLRMFGKRIKNDSIKLTEYARKILGLGFIKKLLDIF